MAFNSLSYLLFLSVVWLAFQWTPDRLRWLLLLLASLGFYSMLKAPYLLVVLGLVAVATYTVGLQLGSCSDDTVRKRLLWAGIGANLMVLVSLKYLPAMLTFIPIHFSPFSTHILVTIGVSYYVFQAISYLADVYLEIADPEPHFGYLFLSLAFFPKLLQGPIERASDLLPQLKKPYVFDYEMARSGMLLFAWGLFKKVVVADRLALFVDPVYNNVHAYTGLPLIIATYYFAIQIYCDFSGYTDMALGTARMFNINLTQNFNNPYSATTIADFWRRWHISFSRWILDYIFKPLQMSWRKWRNYGTALALIVTFLVSGIWHGASFSFIVWGLLHGIYLATSVFYKPIQKKIHHWLGIEKSRLLKLWQIVVTFNLVSFAWIFFRANNLPDAFYIISNLFSLKYYSLKEIFQYNDLLSPSPNIIDAVIILISVSLVYTIDLINSYKINIYCKMPVLTRWMICYLLIMSVIVFGIFSKSSNFIYLKF